MLTRLREYQQEHGDCPYFIGNFKICVWGEGGEGAWGEGTIMTGLLKE